MSHSSRCLCPVAVDCLLHCHQQAKECRPAQKPGQIRHCGVKQAEWGIGTGVSVQEGVLATPVPMPHEAKRAWICALLRYRPHPPAITADGAQRECRHPACCRANACSPGRQSIITPDSNHQESCCPAMRPFIRLITPASAGSHLTESSSLAASQRASSCSSSDSWPWVMEQA